MPRQEAAMRPIRLDALSAERLRKLAELYHGTRDVRVRMRAHMILQSRATSDPTNETDANDPQLRQHAGHPALS